MLADKFKRRFYFLIIPQVSSSPDAMYIICIARLLTQPAVIPHYWILYTNLHDTSCREQRGSVLFRPHPHLHRHLPDPTLRQFVVCQQHCWLC